jgi:threonine dehydrogenase-like Zn-dependent dehydrogenase
LKALIYIDKETLNFQEETDAVALEGETLIKVSATGICGSDMHAYHGLDDRRLPPLILGHEISGINQKNNNPVVINPLITCRSCQECTTGREHLCQKRGLLGMTKPVNRPGGFAEFVSVTNQNIFSVPKDVDLSSLSLTEPTAVAFHAIKIAEQSSFVTIQKSKILIIGGGAIGLLLALILKAKESTNITIVDTNKKRLDVCKKAAKCNSSHPDDSKVLENHYDIIFDAVGFATTRQKSIQTVRQGGVIIHIGLSQAAGEFDFRKTTLQEVTFIGTYCYTNKDFKLSLDMLIEKKLGDLSWLDYRPLKDGAKAFQEIHDGETASPKIILQP